MNGNKVNIESDHGTALKKEWRDLEGDGLLSPNDAALFDSLSEYMKGRLDMEDVKNDPFLPAIEDAVKDLVAGYRSGHKKHTENEDFIRGNFSRAEEERKLLKEIGNIKFEINKNNLDDLSAEWVREWHEKKKNPAAKGSKPEEIRDFVTSSLNPETGTSELNSGNKKRIKVKRGLRIIYVSLMAAAVTGAFIMIRTLLPSSDPGKLYNSFYKPFDVISTVTRGGEVNETNDYSIAVEQYKIGNYQAASIGLLNILRNDTSAVAPRFLMGITQIAIGNYSKAEGILSSIAGRSGEYHKESLWYLGLAYLKTGEKEKASDCFESLTQSPGFYSHRAGLLLRRLK